MNIQLKERYNLYIDGRWIPASDGSYFTSKNPATGEALAQCAEATKEEAIAAGKEAIADKLTGNIVKEIYVPKKIINIVQK